MKRIIVPVGLTLFFFAYTLAELLLREVKPRHLDLQYWASLTPLGKFSLVCFCVSFILTFHIVSKRKD